MQVHDGYCERIGTEPNFWGEPVNALTNLAFYAAVYWLFLEARKRERLDSGVVSLIFLVFCIGTGSFLFHTFATNWALASDVIPIQAFIILYFGVVLYHVHGLGLLVSIVGAFTFLPLAAGMQFLLAGTLLGGANAGYVSALLLLFVNAVILAIRHHAIVPWLAAGSGVFVLSLAFRILDEHVCSAFPTGTHFAWHILNSVVLAIVATGFIRHGHRRRGQAAADSGKR